jgi:hypothetical protein
MGVIFQDYPVTVDERLAHLAARAGIGALPNSVAERAVMHNMQPACSCVRYRFSPRRNGCCTAAVSHPVHVRRSDCVHRYAEQQARAPTTPVAMAIGLRRASPCSALPTHSVSSFVRGFQTQSSFTSRQQVRLKPGKPVVQLAIAAQHACVCRPIAAQAGSHTAHRDELPGQGEDLAQQVHAARSLEDVQLLHRRYTNVLSPEDLLMLLNHTRMVSNQRQGHAGGVEDCGRALTCPHLAGGPVK